MTLEAVLAAVLIFVLRVINYAIGTLRMVAIARNRRLLSSVLAALEALIFAVVIANIVNDLDNIVNMVAYCAGASGGNYVGLVLEARLVKSFAIVNIFTSRMGHDIAVALREAGYGVTEQIGEGRDGTVVTLRSVINKREVSRMTRIVHSVNQEAFVAVEEARSVQRGWLGTGHGKLP
ncbi:MAG: hypothetical protein OHK0046_15980 [Anaerolineae bacterium]